MPYGVKQTAKYYLLGYFVGGLLIVFNKLLAAFQNGEENAGD